MFAHRAIVEHEVLQRVMQTEPEKLLPALTVESNRDPRSWWPSFLTPYLVRHGVAEGVDLDGGGRLPGPDGPLLHRRHRAGGTSTTRPRWPGWSGPSCWPASGEPVTVTRDR